jgi:hypothetical protein
MSPEAVELDQLIKDTFWTEKGHFVLASWWRGAHMTIGLVATVASAVAGTAIIARSNPVLPGVAAFVATVAGGLLTFLKPSERADPHLKSGRKLGALRVEMRQTLNLDLRAGAGSQELRRQIADLAKRKADLDNAAPHIADVAMWWVDRRMKRGAFTSN